MIPESLFSAKQRKLGQEHAIPTRKGKNLL